MHHHAIILGAGASGLSCALKAGKKGRRVLLLDHAQHPGAKIRAAGGGRCNCTNLAAGASTYLCSNPHFVKSALARFTPWDVQHLFSELRIPLVEEDAGRVFTALGKKGGRRVAEALHEEVLRRNVTCLMDVSVEDVAFESGRFLVRLPGETFQAEALVLALGGRSWPSLGASDLGHRLAKQFGLPLTPCKPGLTPLEASGKTDVRGGDRAFCASLAGVALPVTIRQPQTSPAAPEISADLLFTHRGISGPAVLDASLFWHKGQSLHIDFLPGADVTSLLAATPRLELKNALARHMPQRLAQALCERHGLGGNCAGLSKKQLRALEGILHAWTFTPARAAGWDKAEVTLGGVDTRAVSSKTMQANDVPGLYLTGELLDVTGRLGGYNLQWAWSSGWVAGAEL